MSSSNSQRVDFQGEIESMMYSFGDIRRPNPESVVLIERIVHAQMAEIVVKAAEVTHLRGGRSMSVEDIFFLLRKNPDKLKTLLRYLKLKDLAKRTKSTSAEEEEGSATSDDIMDMPPAKKGKYSLEFLNHSDQAKVDIQEQDQTSLYRMQCMDRITKDMDDAEYLNYSRCRRVNFHKNTTKFSAWLNLNCLVDSKLSQETVEVFGHIAYEAVREIVELSLRVKEDVEHTSLKPFNSCSPNLSSISQIRHITPSISSPITPTTQPEHSPSSSPLPLTPNSNGQYAPRLRTTSTSLETPRIGGGKHKTCAIDPRHIREAMRRFSFTMGPMIPLSSINELYVLSTIKKTTQSQ